LPLFSLLSVTMKRAREDCDGELAPPKVRRVINFDRLSKLSDELLVRILSFVPVNSLLVCQRYHPNPLHLKSALTSSGCQRSSAASLSIPSFGKLHTIGDLSFRAHPAYQESRTLAPPTGSTTLRGCRNGSMMEILSKMESKLIGSSSIDSGTIGPKGNALSVRSLSLRDALIRLCSS